MFYIAYYFYILPISTKHPVHLPHLLLASVCEMQSAEIFILVQGKHNSGNSAP